MVINGSELVTLSVRAKRSEDEHYVSNYAHLMLGNTSSNRLVDTKAARSVLSSSNVTVMLKGEIQIRPFKSISKPVMGKFSAFDFVKSQWESLSFEPQDLSGKVIIVTGSNV
ncbi:hypothetical protein BC936DRAFT_137832, partial [Jimgerdemannia flammicorona]